MILDLTTSFRGTPAYSGGDAKFGSYGLSGGVLKGSTIVGSFFSSTGANGGTLTTGTAEAWVKSSYVAGRKVFLQRDGWFYLSTDNGVAYAEYSYGGSAKFVTGGSSIMDGNWHHVALVFNATVASLYVDGTRVGTNSNAGSAIGNGVNEGFYVGGFAASAGFDWPGSVDEVRLSATSRYIGATYTTPTAAFVPDADTHAIYHLENNGTAASGTHYLLDFSDTSVGPTMDYSQSAGKIRVDTDIPSGVGATKSLSWMPLQNLNDTAEFSMPVTISATGAQVAFYRKTSSESGSDLLRFYIDDVQQGSWSGETAWGQVSYPIATGAHTLKWRFSHDGSIWSGSNTAWIALLEIINMATVPPTTYSAASPATFDFENGLIPPRVITTSWTNSTDAPISGTRSMRTPAVTVGDGIYDLHIDTSYFTENGVVSFDYKRDAEGPDRLKFLVDGVQIWPTPHTGNSSTDAGNTHWVIPPGTSSITVRYQKDGTVNAGADAVWIDNLVLPFYTATSVSVVDVVNGAAGVVTADPTIALTSWPIAGDVMVLIAMNGDGVNATAVSGLGATWTKVTFVKGISYGSVWVGTGATSTGTVTATQVASGTGRFLQLYHLRGVDPTVIAYGADNQKIGKLGNPNQVVIAVGNGSGGTNGLLTGSYYPAAASWTIAPNVEMSAGRNVIGAYIIPSAPGTFYAESDREVSILSVGAPGSVIVRKNLIPKPGFGDGNTNNYGWANITGQTIDNSIYHSGAGAIKGTASAANAEFSMYSANTGATVTIGQTYTWSAWVRCNQARTAVVGVTYAGGTPTTWGTATSVPANTWTRVSKTEIAAAGGNIGRMTVRFTDSVNTDLIWADDFMCEAGETLGDYFDGAVFDTARQNYWDGTENTSVSTQVAFGASSSTTRTNLVTNPTFDVDTVGWSATGGTVNRYTGAVWLGIAVGRMNFTTGIAALAATMTTSVTGLTIGQTYTASLMAYRVSNYTPVVIFANDGTVKYGTSTLNSGGFELLKVTFVAAAATVTVGIANTELTGAAQVAYVDGVTLQLGTDAEPFCGSTVNTAGITYAWLGTPHNSQSVKKVGRTNQMRNPSFGDGTRFGWNGTGTVASTITLDTTEGAFGNTKCIKAVPTSSGSGALLKGTSGSGNTAEMCPVIPGRTYTVSGYIRTSTGQSVRIDVAGANASGVLTATSYTSASYINPIAGGGGIWTRFKQTYTVAAGDYFLVPTVYGAWSAGAVNYLDGFMIEEGGSAGPYFDGEPQNDWTVNAWTGAQYLSPSTQAYAPITTPTVVGVHTGATSTAANPTLNMPVTPLSTDVLILITAWSTSAANPAASAVTGLGATWTQLSGANEFMTAWIGTGASTSGTITATATAITNGRNLRLYHLRGVSADAIFRQTDTVNDPIFMSPNQVAIGLGYASTLTVNSFIERSHPSMWHDEAADVTFAAGSTRHWNSAWMIPPGGQHVYHDGSSYGGVIAVGSPVANTRVIRRNPVGNASLETQGGANTNYIPTTLTTAQVHHGKAAYGGVTSNSPAKFVLGSSIYGYPEIAPNKQYTFSAWVWCSASRPVAIVPNWRSSGQANITTETPSYTTIPANTWTQVTWTGTSYYNAGNYGAYHAIPEVWITNVTGDTVYVDAIQIDEGPVALPFLDATYTPSSGQSVFTLGNRYSSSADGWFPQGYHTMLVGPPGIAMKFRQAGAWVEYPGTGWAYVDDEWVEADIKYWNGTEWVIP